MTTTTNRIDVWDIDDEYFNWGSVTDQLAWMDEVDADAGRCTWVQVPNSDTDFVDRFRAPRPPSRVLLLERLSRLRRGCSVGRHAGVVEVLAALRMSPFNDRIVRGVELCTIDGVNWFDEVKLLQHLADADDWTSVSEIFHVLGPAVDAQVKARTTAAEVAAAEQALAAAKVALLDARAAAEVAFEDAVAEVAST